MTPSLSLFLSLSEHQLQATQTDKRERRRRRKPQDRESLVVVVARMRLRATRTSGPVNESASPSSRCTALTQDTSSHSSVFLTESIIFEYNKTNRRRRGGGQEEEEEKFTTTTRGRQRISERTGSFRRNIEKNKKVSPVVTLTCGGPPADSNEISRGGHNISPHPLFHSLSPMAAQLTARITSLPRANDTNKTIVHFLSPRTSERTKRNYNNINNSNKNQTADIQIATINADLPCFVSE